MKTRVRSVWLLFALAAWLVPTASKADTEQDIRTLLRNKPRIAAIVSEVAQPGGHIDKEVHSEFWALWPISTRANAGAFVGSAASRDASHFQRELWESIRLSARSGRVTKTIGYDAAFLRSFRSAAAREEGAHKANGLLDAAATGKPYCTASKGCSVPTEEMANEILDNFEKMDHRLNLLMDPIWRGDDTPDSGSDDHIADDELPSAAALANRGLPRNVGNDTQLDRVSAGPGRRISYFLTLTNRSSADVTATNVAAGRAAQVRLACSSESVLGFLRDDIAVRYSYRTADGSLFTTLDIAAKDCLRRPH